jgi:hypothetical protein
LAWRPSAPRPQLPMQRRLVHAFAPPMHANRCRQRCARRFAPARGIVEGDKHAAPRSGQLRAAHADRKARRMRFIQRRRAATQHGLEGITAQFSRNEVRLLSRTAHRGSIQVPGTVRAVGTANAGIDQRGTSGEAQVPAG